MRALAGRGGNRKLELRLEILLRGKPRRFQKGLRRLLMEKARPAARLPDRAALGRPVRRGNQKERRRAQKQGVQTLWKGMVPQGVPRGSRMERQAGNTRLRRRHDGLRRLRKRAKGGLQRIRILRIRGGHIQISRLRRPECRGGLFARYGVVEMVHRRRHFQGRETLYKKSGWRWPAMGCT